MTTAVSQCRVEVPSERDSLLGSQSANETSAGHYRDYQGDQDSSERMDVVLPRRRFVTEPLVLLYCIGILSQMSVIAQYLYYRIGIVYNATGNATRAFVCDPRTQVNSTEYEVTAVIQIEASQWVLYRNLACNGVALLLMPAFASASDYIGRRPALLFPCAGLAVDSAGLLLVIALDLPLVWLVISGGLGALGGGYGALFAGVFAYVADTSSIRQRPVRVAIIEGMLGLAGCVVEPVFGWWMRLAGYTAPIGFSAGVTLASLAYATLLVPEVRPGRHGGGGRGGCCTIGSLSSPFVNIARLFASSRRLAVTLGLVLTSVFFYSAGIMGVSNLSYLYQMNYPFCLDSVVIGYLNAVKILCFQLGVLAALVVFRRCLGLKPLSLTLIGLASAIAGFILTGAAQSATTLFLAAGISLFSMVPIPMLRAHASQVAPPGRQGALFSCFAVVEVAGNLAGSVAFALVYSSTQAWMPGFVYLTVAGACAVSLTLTGAACGMRNSGGGENLRHAARDGESQPCERP